MATINIGASNADDAFYRYKMPKLVAKIEGRGNGIKTNIVNNVDIAKSLERPPEYVLKYFGYELGAQTNFDKGTGTCIVNGAHDGKKLSEFLEGFIKKYVQCYSCGNPETQVKVKKEDLFLKCKACGFVSEVDPRLKLNGFILKNPPENKMTKEEKKLKKQEEERVKDAEKAEKRERKEKKEKKEKDKRKKKDKDEGKEVEESEETENEDADEDGVVWMTDTSEDAAKRRAQEQLTAATAAMVTQGNIEAEAEAQRKKAEKEAKKKAEEEAQAKAAEESKAKEEEARKLAEKTEKLALQNGSANPVCAIRKMVADGAKPSEIASHLKSIDVKGGLTGKLRVLVEAVLGATAEGQKIVDVVSANKAVLAANAKEPPSQLALVIALEYFFSVIALERVKELPIVFKGLYDMDLVEEDIILAWAGKRNACGILGLDAGATEAARNATAPFVAWLEEADETEEESEEDDE